MGAHGTLKGYRQGCGCDPCYSAMQDNSHEYQERVARERLGATGESATVSNITRIRLANKDAQRVVNGYDTVDNSQSASKTEHMGDMERAVVEECQGLSLATERPAMVVSARHMARILDNPKQQALWPTTTRQLTAILNDLHGNSKKRARSRLASVQRMVQKPGSAT